MSTRRKPRTVFWGNARVSHEAIIGQQRQTTLARVRGERRVLLVQDTTSYNFSQHSATKGLGPLENEHCRGFMAHNTLAVSEAGVPLGMLEQVVWARAEEARSDRHRRAFEDKESYKWVAGLPDAVTQAVLPEAIVMSDRESHIYEYLDELLERGLGFVIRATQGRGFTLEGQDVFAALTVQPVQARLSLNLKRHPDREAREAEVDVRFTPLTLKRPQRSSARRDRLTVHAVEVVEPHPPPGESPVHWLLLTSLPVETLDQAQTVIRYYTYRWLIERFHFVLKSGCKIEDSQLRDLARLERLLAVFSLVAWHLLWLTYQARLTPDAPCTLVLQTHEWQALFAFHHRSQRLPSQPPSLHQATRWIAQLGGFLARKGDGEPGVKVLWRGWTRLQDIADTWSILHPPSPDVGNV
jgi:hypothetical protein